MRMVVCIKQVPATQQVEMDEQHGTLKRLGVASRMNPYDEVALEMALRLKEQHGGEVIALSMGPPQADLTLREALWTGADRAILLTDRAFAGADVLATSYTLAMGIRYIKGVDLVLCGKQTTDGDTAQVGPAMAEWLDIPHACLAREAKLEEQGVEIEQELSDCITRSYIPTPCLLTMDSEAAIPRLPSHRLRIKHKETQIEHVSMSEVLASSAPIEGAMQGHWGLDGSPTQVDRIYIPDRRAMHDVVKGTTQELVQALDGYLKTNRLTTQGRVV